MLSDLQRVVLAQLRRRNHHIVAEEAERCWSQGQRTELDVRTRCPRWLRHLFVEANDEITKESPNVAECSGSELCAAHPRRRRTAKAYEWKIVAVRECPSPDTAIHCELSLIHISEPTRLL